MNSDRIRREHSQCCLILAKKPEAIWEQTTMQKVAMNHDHVGMAGEAIEVMKAIVMGDNENLLEEAGDFLFYHCDFGLVFNCPVYEEFHLNVVAESGDDLIVEALIKHLELTEDPAAEESISNMGSDNLFLFIVGELCDRIKKIDIYDQLPEDHKEAIYELHWLAQFLLGEILEQHGFGSNPSICPVEYSILKAREHNLAKLAKRYPDGYSDAAARARADKQASNDAAAELEEDLHRDRELKRDDDRPEPEPQVNDRDVD